MAGSVVMPGVRLCPSDNVHLQGHGTYTQHGYIYSSLVGVLRLVTNADKTVTVEVDGLKGDSLVPGQQDVVTVKIVSVNPRCSKKNMFSIHVMCHFRFAKCHIMCVGEVVLSEHYRGQIRKEDVRATEKDRVEMYKCFRPGDIVLARVISLGDAGGGYLLTTAENSLGVVIARSEAGSLMVPVSWTEMQCTASYSVEERKVAKVIPEHLAKLSK